MHPDSVPQACTNVTSRMSVASEDWQFDTVRRSRALLGSELNQDEDQAGSTFNTVRSPKAATVPSSLRVLFEDANAPATPRQEPQSWTFPSRPTHIDPEPESPKVPSAPVRVEPPKDVEREPPPPESTSISLQLPPPTPPIVRKDPDLPVRWGEAARPFGHVASASALAPISTDSSASIARPHLSPTHQSAYSLDLSPTTSTYGTTLSPPPMMRTRSATTLVTAHTPVPLTFSFQTPSLPPTESHSKTPSVDHMTSRGTPGLKDVLKVLGTRFPYITFLADCALCQDTLTLDRSSPWNR